ncbi:hypothetical protein [Amycolatopsis saalfeldensis]|uniref:hypothetical protein n=1 Tax=Amycolatopsis saalfeldensis TaxID=394193 RepID=UPI001160B66B|nr:hypothetical protein [Amycolatopsis saalfeldensis]
MRPEQQETGGTDVVVARDTRRVPPGDLCRADEIFLTGTAGGIMPAAGRAGAPSAAAPSRR